MAMLAVKSTRGAGRGADHSRDHVMSSSNPFEVSGTVGELVATEPRGYGRMDRWRFCVYSTTLLLLQLACFIALGRAQAATATQMITALIAALLALQVLVVAARLQHMGYDRVRVWVLLVTPLNAVLLLLCVTAPMGYHQHGKYDRNGRLGAIGLLTAALVLGILALDN